MELKLQNVIIGPENVTISSLKCHYRVSEIFFFFLKLDFEKVEFQKKRISLISLGNGVECYLVCPKRAEANFVRYLWHIHHFKHAQQFKE